MVFLLIRLELLLPILNAVLSFWRNMRGWKSGDAVLEVGPRRGKSSPKEGFLSDFKVIFKGF